MASTAQTYRDAAKENLLRAQATFNTGQYFLSHYLSGLAVECHLRAYLLRTKTSFDSRHDLRELAKESKFFSVIAPSSAKNFSAKFATLNSRWRSNHRYYSERQFLEYMTENGAEFEAKGERWKNLARTTLNLAYDIINLGESKWSSR